MLVAMDSVALCKLHAVLWNERSYPTHVSINIDGYQSGKRDFRGLPGDFPRLPETSWGLPGHLSSLFVIPEHICVLLLGNMLNFSM